jgi:deoxyxylulose-5-phosphate synthase
MPTPTTSVRLPRDYHQLLHDIARAIKADPAFAESLRAVLGGRNTATHGGITERLDALEARLAALEERPAMRAIREPRDSGPRPSGKRKAPVTVTDELRREAHDMRAAGHTQEAISFALGIGAGTVSKILSEPRPD